MAKRKRHVELDAQHSVMKDIAMFAARAEFQFYQRIAQIQSDVKAGRHAIYHFTDNREVSPPVALVTKQSDPRPATNGSGQPDLVHDEPENPNQRTSSNNPAQTQRPLQTEDSPVTPAGIPGAKNCLVGFSFVFTGDFEGLSREKAKVLVQLHGGKVDGFPTTKTNYVVLGNDVDPHKLEILKKKHLKTISEAGLYDLIRTFSRSPRSDVLQLKRRRIEQALKESVESRTSGSRDRYTDEQNFAWSGEPKVADDALRFAQSRVSRESAYHASVPLTVVSKPPSSANDSMYSSRASWTPEPQPAAHLPVPYAQKSVLDSDVLKMISALPAQSVNPMQSMSAAVASTRTPPVVHDNRAKPTPLDVFQSGAMRVIGSLHDLVETDETREDSYSPPCADVPSLVIDKSGPDGRLTRLRGVSQPIVGTVAHYPMSISNVDADEDNKSESDYSPPPADMGSHVPGTKILSAGPPSKKVEGKQIVGRKARRAQALLERQEANRIKAARKAENKAANKAAQKAAEARRTANQASAQKAAKKAANKAAAKKAATQKAVNQLQQKPKAPRRSKRLLQIALDNQYSADPIEVVSSANAAPLQYGIPPRAPPTAPTAPKAERFNQEHKRAQQPVRIRQTVEESSADDESWQPTSRIKREPESEPRYSRYNVDTDSRKLLLRNDGGVDIGVNSPPRTSDRQLPYGQKPLPQQWPYERGSQGQANLESSEDGATTARKRDSQKHANRTQPSGHNTVRPAAARHDSVPREMPPPPRRRIIVDEYGNKYIAIPATGPFADMPELQDLLNGSGEPGLSAPEKPRVTQARQRPTNVIDLEDSDCFEDPHPPPTAPKAMLSMQKNAAQTGEVTLSKSQKRKAHREMLEQQRRDQHEQYILAQKQNKNANKAVKVVELPKAQAGPANNVPALEAPTYSPVPYERLPYTEKGWIAHGSVAPYVPELRGLVQPQPPQIPAPLQTPLPPMSARMQAPLPHPGMAFPPPPPMSAPFQPMYGQFPPPPPMAGFGGPPHPYSPHPGFASGTATFQNMMPVMANNPGFPRASPYVQAPPYVQTPVFGQMPMYPPQPSPFVNQMAPAR